MKRFGFPWAAFLMVLAASNAAADDLSIESCVLDCVGRAVPGDTGTGSLTDALVAEYVHFGGGCTQICSRTPVEPPAVTTSGDAPSHAETAVTVNFRIPMEFSAPESYVVPATEPDAPYDPGTSPLADSPIEMLPPLPYSFVSADPLLPAESIADEPDDGNELVFAAASHECDCFGKFKDGDNACKSYSGGLGGILFQSCDDFTFDYTSSVTCSTVTTDTVVSNGGYWAAPWGSYSWSKSPVYAYECFDK